MIRDERRLNKQPMSEIARLDAWRKKADANPRKYMEKYLLIKTQNAQMAYLKANASQNIVIDAVDQAVANGEPGRFIILKSRRVGISTISSGLLFTKTVNNYNTNSLIMAHLRDIAEEVFQQCHLFYDNLPPAIRPRKDRSSKKELGFPDLRSRLTISASNTTNATRSKTLQDVLLTECGFYDNIPLLRASVEACVPLIPNTNIIWESTAQGAGTDFHRLWEEASKGESIYKTIFLKWFLDPNEQLRPFLSQHEADAYAEAMFARLPSLKDRQEHFGLTLRQIGYYYEILRDRYSFDERLMQQEYPCTPEEAFLASGTSIFPLNYLENYRKHTSDPIATYDPTEPFTNLSNALVMRNAQMDRDSYIKVWVPPQTGRHYLISADPARGLETSDFSAGYVFDISTQNIVAAIHGRMDMRLFANTLKRLGRIYNDAVIIPEVNGLGAGLLEYLKEDYHNIYRARRDDGFGVMMTNKLGWTTTNESRLKCIGLARRYWSERHDDPHFIPDFMLLNEIKTFVQGQQEKPEAQKGCHDDRVMAFAIGLQGCHDELVQRPELAQLVTKATTTDSIIKPATTREIIELMRNPFYIGAPLKTDLIESGPFVPLEEIDD